MNKINNKYVRPAIEDSDGVRRLFSNPFSEIEMGDMTPIVIAYDENMKYIATPFKHFKRCAFFNVVIPKGSFVYFIHNSKK